MKYISFLIAILFSISVSAQNYSDSTVTVTLTQRAAVIVGQYVKTNTSAAWSNRLAPAQLKPFINNATNLDSVFSVTLKADYIIGMIELLLSSSNEVVQADRLAIINNSPTNPNGYTALQTQIINIANGNSSQKNTAIFIRDYYQKRLTDFANVRSSIISEVLNWSKN